MENFMGNVLNSKLKVLIEKLIKTRYTVEQQITSLGFKETNDVYNHLKAIKKEIDGIEDVLPGQIKKIKKRIKKRRYLKKIKALKFESIKETEENRQIIHSRINKQLESRRNAFQENRNRYKMNAARNQALAGVNTRIADADKFINKLISLKQLRQLRKNVYTHLPDYNKTHFNQGIDQIITVWINAKLEYEKEKSLIEDSFKLMKSNEESWYELLFGESCKFYNKNQEDNLEEFLKIRHDWDKYIVPASHPEGTSIPIGWVLPKENVSNAWDCYRSDI